jgi:hypothetical protein
MLISLTGLTPKLPGLTVLLFVLIQISACAKTDREQQLYQMIKHGVELAEEHDLSGLMDLTQDGFIAGPGNLPRQEVRKILFITFKRFGKFNIHHPKPSIRLSVDEEKAVVKMSFLMASQGQVFPELKLLYEDAAAWVDGVDKRADLYTLSMELEYESGSWLVKKAQISGFARPHGRL